MHAISTVAELLVQQNDQKSWRYLKENKFEISVEIHYWYVNETNDQSNNSRE